YEESIRIPLLMRLPALIKPSTAVDAMVLNVDIAPTVLELAGAPIPTEMQGRSLVPVLQGGPVQVPWRGSFLIEHFSEANEIPARVRNLDYQAVRTAGWKYIHYTKMDNADELYDLY